MINLISSMLTNLGILKKINDVISGVNEHIDNKNNPHQVTAEQLGLAAAYTYQGDVDNFASLPTQGVQKGWVYNVKTEFILNNEKYPAGTDVAWDGSKWNTLGGSLKGYIRKVNNIAPDSDSNVNIKSLIPTNIQTAADLNNIKAEGRYQCDTDSVAATLLNAPLRTAFYLDVYVNSSTQVKQVITANTTEMKIFMRTLVNGAWSGWQRVQFVTGVHDIQEIKNSANNPIKLTGSFSHKYNEVAGGKILLASNIDVYWVTPATSDVGVTINLSNLVKQEGYSRLITLYVDGSKCPNLRTITYTNKPTGFTLVNEPERLTGGMVNVIGIEVVNGRNIYTITNNGSTSGVNSVLTVNGVEPDDAGSVDVPIGVPIGFEYFSTNPNIQAGSIPLMGGLYSRATYADLWEWVQQQKGYLLRESEWQSKAAANGGNVSFYSDGDGTTTFRVPSLKCWVKGANGLAEVGSYLEAALPNITGVWDVNGLTDDGYAKNDSFANGAFSIVESRFSKNSDVFGEGKSASIDFDASRSNPIYGQSTTVQPQFIVGLWLVKAFGTVSNIGNQDIADVAQGLTELETKVGNLNNTVNEMTDYVVESYRNGTDWYRKYKSGWIEQGGRTDTIGSGGRRVVTFLKAFADANYSTNIGGIKNTSYGATVITKLEATQMEVLNSTNSSGQINWAVKGQGA